MLVMLVRTWWQAQADALISIVATSRSAGVRAKHVFSRPAIRVDSNSITGRPHVPKMAL